MRELAAYQRTLIQAPIRCLDLRDTRDELIVDMVDGITFPFGRTIRGSVRGGNYDRGTSLNIDQDSRMYNGVSWRNKSHAVGIVSDIRSYGVAYRAG
jgi:hypothetical protein